MSARTDDLSDVVPPSRSIVLDGVEHTLRPVNLGQLPQVIAALKPVGDTLTGLKNLDATDAEQTGAVLLAVLLEHPLVLVDALVAVSGLPRKAVEGADLAQGVDMLAALVELNADFFSRAVAPKLTGLLAAVGRPPQMPPPGPTPSSA